MAFFSWMVSAIDLNEGKQKAIDNGIEEIKGHKIRFGK